MAPLRAASTASSCLVQGSRVGDFGTAPERRSGHEMPASVRHPRQRCRLSFQAQREALSRRLWASGAMGGRVSCCEPCHVESRVGVRPNPNPSLNPNPNLSPHPRPRPIPIPTPTPTPTPSPHPHQAEEGYQAQLQQEMQQLRERQYDESELDAIGRLQARPVVTTPVAITPTT